MAKPTAIRECGDTAGLMAEVPRLVGAALREVAHWPQDYEDLRQEGLVAGLAAVRTWAPERGAFSTYLMPRIRGAILNYQRANSSLVRTPRSVASPLSDVELDAPETDDPTDEAVTGADRLVYPTPPHGFGSPEATITRNLTPEVAERLLKRLNGEQEAVLRALYGVGVPRQSLREIAAERGCAAGTVFNIAREAEQFLEQVRETTDTRYSSCVNEGPSRVRREHVPADRFLGFWNEGEE